MGQVVWDLPGSFPISCCRKDAAAIAEAGGFFGTILAAGHRTTLVRSSMSTSLAGGHAGFCPATPGGGYLHQGPAQVPSLPAGYHFR